MIQNIFKCLQYSKNLSSDSSNDFPFDCFDDCFGNSSDNFFHRFSLFGYVSSRPRFDFFILLACLACIQWLHDWFFLTIFYENVSKNSTSIPCFPRKISKIVEQYLFISQLGIPDEKKTVEDVTRNMTVNWLKVQIKMNPDGFHEISFNLSGMHGTFKWNIWWLLILSATKLHKWKVQKPLLKLWSNHVLKISLKL